MRKILSVLTVFFALTSIANAGGKNDSSDCLGSLRQMLVEGGYSGATDCAGVKIRLKEIGAIRQGANEYTIYDLRYRTIPEGGSVAHGGQKILVFLNNKTYLGQYALDPPWRRLCVEGNSVLLDLPKDLGNEIRVDSAGFPGSVRIDEDWITFNK